MICVFNNYLLFKAPSRRQSPRHNSEVAQAAGSLGSTHWSCRRRSSLLRVAVVFYNVF